MNSKTIEFDTGRWSRVEELFSQAFDLPGARRAAFLQAECGDDSELLEYLLALLGAESGIDATIEGTIAAAIDATFGERPTDELEGEMIGPYRVERLLGSGGMGMVYLARRADEQFDQQVAIKLGRHRLVDPQTELRLKNERQILADLDHPNIAKLFDGGTTPEGVPYLVMEYIDGIRLDEYCDRHRLSISERLRLFQTICAAVHYAHQNLIVHRDIKPSNILVTDDGVPKLLDFGIAKLVDTQGTATDGLTREGAVVLTPENAAPEQILGKGVTTATDTYGLGLLLYYILSGVRPLNLTDTAPHEFARLVCSENPAKPSAKLSEAGGTPSEIESIAEARNTTFDRLQRSLRGDVDTIVLKAIRKEPERRYRSVSALADDIGLYLRSMPIAARSDSWRYRTGKFVRRHYASVAASAAALVVLIGFSVVVSMQNQRIIEERDTARAASAYLEAIFMTPDPAQARGANVTAKEILDAGASRIRTDLDSSPEIRSTLMGTIGRVYFNLGEFEPAADMLEEALSLRIEVFGADDPMTAAAQNDLAEALIQQAAYPEARELLEAGLATYRAHLPEISAEIGNNLMNLAELQVKIGAIDEATALADQSSRIFEALGAGWETHLAETYSIRARVLQMRGDLDAAEALIEEAISLVEATQGNDHPHLAVYLQSLGVLQYSKSDYEAAAATLAEAIDTSRRVLGGHDLLAATLRDRGSVLQAQGDFDGAEALMREALAIDIESRGVVHPRVGLDMTILGRLLHDKGDLGGAENILSHAVDVFDDVFSMDHQYTASALTELGAVLNSSGRSAEALPLLERAVQIRSIDYSSADELYAATQTEYADALIRLGRLGEAEPLLDNSEQVFADSVGRRQQRTQAAIERLAAARAAAE